MFSSPRASFLFLCLFLNPLSHPPSFRHGAVAEDEALPREQRQRETREEESSSAAEKERERV